MKDSNTKRFIFNENLDSHFLEDLFDGDAVYAQTVFEDFLRDLPDYWKDVDNAYTNGDQAALRAAVHKCKTLFGYVGFTDIQQFCQEFENNCRGNTLSRPEKGYKELLQRKEEARRIIEEDYNRLKSFNAL